MINMENQIDEWVLYEDNNNIRKNLEFIKDKLNKIEEKQEKEMFELSSKLDNISQQYSKIIKQNEHLLKSINHGKSKTNVDVEQIRSYNRNWRGSYIHGGLLPFAYNYNATP